MDSLPPDLDLDDQEELRPDQVRLREHEKASAAAILANLAAVYVPKHEYRRVEARDFGHLDLGFYDRCHQFLRGEGFSMLADVQNLTIESAPGNVLAPVFLRSWISSDGTSTAAAYHAKIRPLLLRALLFLLGRSRNKILEFETEFEDGGFLCTSNAQAAAALRTPPLIDMLYLPARTSLKEIHATHLRRLAQAIGRRVPRRIGSFEEMIASQDRMSAIKAAFRGELGGITRQELERLSPLGRGVARGVADRMDERREAGVPWNGSPGVDPPGRS